MPSEVFEGFGPISEVENVGESFSFSVCVCVLAVPPSVPVAIVLVSNVNVVCEVVFSDCDCEFVELQIFSLTRKHKVSFVVSRKYMNNDETRVKAPSASRRKAAVPTPQ